MSTKAGKLFKHRECAGAGRLVREGVGKAGEALQALVKMLLLILNTVGSHGNILSREGHDWICDFRSPLCMEYEERVGVD